MALNNLNREDVYEALSLDLEDAARLDMSPRVSRLYKESKLSDRLGFRDAVMNALIPIAPGKQRPTKNARYTVLENEIEDMDDNFLDTLVEMTSLQSLDEARQRVSQVIQSVISQEEYQDAIMGYNKQHEAALYRNTLNGFLAKHGYVQLKNVDSTTPLYHGLCMSGNDMELDCHENEQLIEPQLYVNKLRSMLDQGIKASACAENLPHLESVFCVSDIKDAYGLLALRFFLDSKQKAWGHSQGKSSEGHQLVMPVVRGPFEVVVRSSKFFKTLDDAQTKDVFGQMTPDEHRAYISKLAKNLKELSIPFQMIDPDGTIRSPRQKPDHSDSVIAAE